MKMKALIIAFVVGFLIAPCAVNAATVTISGLQPTYNVGDTVSVDVLVGDIGGLENLDIFGVGIQITPGNAPISALSNNTTPGYVFEDHSDQDYFRDVDPSYFAVYYTDIWDDGQYDNPAFPPIPPRITPFPYRPGPEEGVLGALLFSISYDLDTAIAGEEYDITTAGADFNPLWAMGFWDWPDANFDEETGEYVSPLIFNPQEDVFLDQAYSFKVVPIPAAVWLLGSGLLALVGLRRKLS